MVGAAVLLAGGFVLSTLPKSTTAQEDSTIVGGFQDVSVTSDATELLLLALSDEDNYVADVTDRVCVYNVTGLSEQVVAGVNYRFEITGSSVVNATASGWCADDDNSTASSFQVTIFEQTWTNTVQVTSIQSLDLGDGATFSGSGSSSWGYDDVGYSSSAYDSSSSSSSSGSWDYRSAGYSSSSYASSSSSSTSSSGSGFRVGDVGYVGDEDASASTSGSVEFNAGSYYSASASSGADNETVSLVGL